MAMKKLFSQNKANIYFRYLSLLLLSTFFVNSLYAQENSEAANKTIDPSDMTNVYSSASVAINTQENIKLNLSLGGSWSENHQYLAVVEGFLGDKETADKWGSELLNYRVQYFHVITTEDSYLPKVGFSVDYLKEKIGGDNLIAVGALALLPESLTGSWQVFPNLAYIKGDVLGESVNGYMLNLYGSYVVDDIGSYIWLWRN